MLHRTPADWAKSILDREDFVILDTETTGFESNAEAIQVGIVNHLGVPLIDQYLRPIASIHSSARDCHGIQDSALELAPTFADKRDEIQEALLGKLVLIYNAKYDNRILTQTACAHNAMPLVYQSQCAMLPYSEWVGEWNKRGGYKWQKLVGGDHSAIGDCRAVLSILKKMAGIPC